MFQNNRMFFFDTNTKNELKKQNAFLYEIECKGNRCATLGKSQVPAISTVIFPQVLIEPGESQEYTIIFNYIGSEKNAKFAGNFNIISEEQEIIII